MSEQMSEIIAMQSLREKRRTLKPAIQKLRMTQAGLAGQIEKWLENTPDRGPYDSKTLEYLINRLDLPTNNELHDKLLVLSRLLIDSGLDVQSRDNYQIGIVSSQANDGKTITTVITAVDPMKLESLDNICLLPIPDSIIDRIEKNIIHKYKLD